MDFLLLESTPNPESNKVLLTYLRTEQNLAWDLSGHWGMFEL